MIETKKKSEIEVSRESDPLEILSEDANFEPHDASEGLLECELKFNRIFMRSPLGMGLFDPNGRLMGANPAFLEVFGVSDVDEIRKLDLFEHFPMPRELQRRLRRGRTVSTEVRVAPLGSAERSGSGKYPVLNLDLIVTPLGIEEGNPNGYVVQVHPLETGAGDGEAEDLDRADFRTILDIAEDAVSVHDVETGRIVDVNSKMCKLFGYSREEFLGLSVENLSPDEPPYTKKEALDRISREFSGTPKLFEWRGRKRSGESFWLEIGLKKVRISGQDRVLAVARDITHRKRTEAVQRAVFRISNAVLSTNDLPSLFSRIHTELKSLLNSPNFCIALYNRDTDTISLPYASDEMDQNDAFPAGKTLTSSVIKDGAPLLVTRKEIEELVACGRVRTIGTPSEVWLGVPLRASGEVIGALIVQNYHDKTSLTEKDQEILEFVSRQVGLAIERSRACQELGDSESRFRDLMDLLPEVVCEVDLEGNLTLVNQRAYELFGYDRKDLDEGLNILRIIAPESRDMARRNFERVLAGNPSKAREYKVTRKNGTTFPAIIHANAVKRDGRVTGIRAVVVDITERKVVEERFRLAACVASDLIYEWNIRGDTLKWFGDVDGALGFEKGEIPRTIQAWVDLIHPEDRERLVGSVERHRRSREPIEERYRVRTKDGSWRRWSDRGVPVLDETGSPRKWIGVCTDVTDQWDAEERLRANEQLYRSIAHHLPKGIIHILDPDLRYVFNDGEGLSATGVNPEALIGKSMYEVLPAEAAELVASHCRRVLTGESVTFEGPFWGRYFLCNAVPISDGSGTVDLVLILSLDISDRKAAEEALWESERRYRELVENANEAILVFQEGRIRFANPLAFRISGYSPDELIGRSYLEFTPKEDHSIVREHIRRRKNDESGDSTFEQRFISKSGEIRCLEIRTAEITWEGEPATLCLGNDITARKIAEDELKESFRKIERTMKGTIYAIARTVETRDPYTAGHQRRVASIATAIAEEMGLERDQVNAIHLASMIHDIGKINVPTEILSKPGELSEYETDLIRIHPQVGYDILHAIEFPWPIDDIVLQHHERLDGSGYPNELEGEDICLEARILGVADVVEAMSSHRPYRSALGTKRAVDEITRYKGSRYDPDVVDACIRVIESGKVDFGTSMSGTKPENRESG
jgi:PAS domain S-box-containing protein/putative nucleotidyltransferase with HDIG domain